jgi:ankyrin repeat protein
MKDHEGATALDYAASERYSNIDRMLLDDHDANPNTQDLEARIPLTWAARNGHIETVQILVDDTDDVDHEGQYGITLLENAARYGHNDVIRFLAEQGASLTRRIRM